MRALAEPVLRALVEHYELLAWVRRNYLLTASDADRVWLRDVTAHAVADFDAISSRALSVRVHRAMRAAGFNRTGAKARALRFYRVRRVPA